MEAHIGEAILAQTAECPDLVSSDGQGRLRYDPRRHRLHATTSAITGAAWGDARKVREAGGPGAAQAPDASNLRSLTDALTTAGSGVPRCERPIENVTTRVPRGGRPAVRGHS